MPQYGPRFRSRRVMRRPNPGAALALTLLRRRRSCGMLANSVIHFMAAMAIAIQTLIPRAHGQGISWSGVTEGRVIQLEAGVTTTNLSIVASPTEAAGPISLAFTLERQGVVILTQTSAPPFAITFTNLSAGKYFLSAKTLSSGDSILGDLSFDIRAASVRPPNDDWTHASILSVLDTAGTGSNLNATREVNDPTPGAGKSIWWAWTANADGVFTATTAGSNFDTLVNVYSGATLSSLAPITGNDDIGPNSFSQVTFSATNGVTYYFLVDSAAGSAGGQVQLRLVAGAPPSISITSPPDGNVTLVTSSAVATNITVVFTAADPAGITRVDYWFDGGTNVSRSGSLAAPYQLNLTNLLEGHYLLTVAASNELGLINAVNAGFSIISLEPRLVLDRPITPGMVQLGLIGFKGPNYTLQISTNLDAWCGVNGWTNFNGAVKVADTNLAQLPRRFFRATSDQ